MTDIYRYKYMYSTFLKSMFYMPETGYLEVKTKDGRIYKYKNVPFYIWEDLKNERIAHEVFKNIEKYRYTKYDMDEEHRKYCLEKVREILDMLQSKNNKKG